MTIEELASSVDFDPDTTGIDRRRDPSPFCKGPRSPDSHVRARLATACRVCHVPYSPGRVCGYCREKVRRIRAAITTRG